MGSPSAGRRRGGKGLRDIRTTERNGKVIDIIAVADDDEVIMITARGKIQRVHASDISQIGRNTQGVRIMSLDEGNRFFSDMMSGMKINMPMMRKMMMAKMMVNCAMEMSATS